LRNFEIDPIFIGAAEGGSAKGQGMAGGKVTYTAPVCINKYIYLIDI